MSFIWNCFLAIFPAWFRVVILAFIVILFIFLVIKIINAIMGAIPFL